MDLELLQGLISKAWVEEEEKGKYERQAQQEQQAYMVRNIQQGQIPSISLVAVPQVQHASTFTTESSVLSGLQPAV